MNAAAARLARALAPLDQAAAEYHVSKWTLRRMIARGEIAGYRIGPKLIRIDLDELADVVAARRINAGVSQ